MMERYFNIGGPCSAAGYCMLPAMARLPQVVSLISKEQDRVRSENGAHVPANPMYSEIIER